MDVTKFLDIADSTVPLQAFRDFFEELKTQDAWTILDWGELVQVNEEGNKLFNEFLNLFRSGLSDPDDSYFSIIKDVFKMSIGMIEPQIFKDFFDKLSISELQSLYSLFMTESLYADFILKYLKPHQIPKVLINDVLDYSSDLDDVYEYFKDPEFITGNKVLLNRAYDHMLHELIDHPGVSPYKILLNRSFDHYDDSEMLYLNYRIYKNLNTGEYGEMWGAPDIENLEDIKYWAHRTNQIFGYFLFNGLPREEVYHKLKTQYELLLSKRELEQVEQAQIALNWEEFDNKARDVAEYIETTVPNMKYYIAETVGYIYRTMYEDVETSSPDELKKGWYSYLITALKDITDDGVDYRGALSQEQYNKCIEILYEPTRSYPQVILDAFMHEEAMVTKHKMTGLRALEEDQESELNKTKRMLSELSLGIKH